jgi:uncharacterized membrane protein
MIKENVFMASVGGFNIGVGLMGLMSSILLGVVNIAVGCFLIYQAVKDART